MDLDRVLMDLAEQGGSDLHLKVGRPPIFRMAGDLVPTTYPTVTREEMQSALYGIMAPQVQQTFEQGLEADFSYEIPGLARFRVNTFVQRGEIGAVLRLVPLEVPTIDQLGLPPVFKTFAHLPDGLIVVTGPTGSGKSTTLATIVQEINTLRPVHIITIEDPLEFVFTDELATINQRELSIDVLDLDQALRSALRQDPDVVMMGEMRDRATMEFALRAAETGHLVFSTLHTNDASQTLDRILDTFAGDQAKQLRTQLALCLKAVVSQRLAKRADGTGRLAVIEIMINSPQIQQLIAEGDTRGIEKAIESDTYYKMQTFNQHFADLVKKGRIVESEALALSSAPEDLRLLLRGVRRGATADGLGEAMDYKQEASRTPPRRASSAGSGGGSARGGSGAPGKPGGAGGPKGKPAGGPGGKSAGEKRVSRGFDF